MVSLPLSLCMYILLLPGMWTKKTRLFICFIKVCMPRAKACIGLPLLIPDMYMKWKVDVMGRFSYSGVSKLWIGCNCWLDYCYPHQPLYAHGNVYIIKSLLRRLSGSVMPDCVKICWKNVLVVLQNRVNSYISQILCHLSFLHRLLWVIERLIDDGEFTFPLNDTKKWEISIQNS